VAVYVERSFEPWKRILVPFRSALHDGAALELAGRIGAANGIAVTVLQVIGPNDDANAKVGELVDRVAHGGTERTHVDVRIVRHDDALFALVQEVRRGEHDLVVIGVAKEWGLTPAFFGLRHERLARETAANLLIVRRPAATGTALATTATPLEARA